MDATGAVYGAGTTNPIETYCPSPRGAGATGAVSGAGRSKPTTTPCAPHNGPALRRRARLFGREAFEIPIYVRMCGPLRPPPIAPPSAHPTQGGHLTVPGGGERSPTAGCVGRLRDASLMELFPIGPAHHKSRLCQQGCGLGSPLGCVSMGVFVRRI